MATAPMTVGQMKELASAIIEAIPADLPSETAQNWIGRKSDLGCKIRAIFQDQEAVLSDINWQRVYYELGMEAEYGAAIKAVCVQQKPGYWVVPVVKGVTANKVVAALKKLGVKFYLYRNDLDKSVTVNDRDPNRDGSYAVAFQKTIEADEENKNKSANQLKKAGHKGIALLERLLLEIGYFLATGNHLDIKNLTLCAGSRYSGGDVPSVGWISGSRRVDVGWDNPDNRYDYLRSRSAVSCRAEVAEGD